MVDKTGKASRLVEENERLRRRIVELEGAADVAEAKRVALEAESLVRFPSENPNPVLRVWQDGRIVYANQSSSSLLAEWSCSVGDLLPPDIRDVLAGCMAMGAPTATEVVCGQRIFSLSFAPIPGADYVNVYGLDTTERVQAEEALRRSEAEYRGLFENAMMGISQSSPDGRLVRANQAYAQMYGYSTPQEMIADGRPDVAKFYAIPEERAEVFRILSDKGVMEPREVGVIKRDGSHLVVLVSMREIRDANGKLLCYQAEHVDVTVRKATAAALRESEARFRDMFERSTIGKAMSEYDGKLDPGQPGVC